MKVSSIERRRSWLKIGKTRENEAIHHVILDHVLEYGEVGGDAGIRENFSDH